MVKYGTKIKLIVFSIRELSEMEANIWLAQEEKNGSPSKAVNIQLDSSLVDPDVKNCLKIDRCLNIPNSFLDGLQCVCHEGFEVIGLHSVFVMEL